MKLIAASSANNRERMVQGGSTVTERFEPNVKSFQVFVSSEGRPINCRIELVSGPNNVKQVMEVYSDEGQVRPFYAVLETQGFLEGIVRIINCRTIEFPFCSIVAPWEVVSKRDMYKEINETLGRTSQPLEITGNGSTFGNFVAQMGGFGSSSNDNNNMEGFGTVAVAAPVPTKKKKLFVPAAAALSSASNKTSGKKNMTLSTVKELPVNEKDKYSQSKNEGAAGGDDGGSSTEKILMDIWDKKLENKVDDNDRRKAKLAAKAAADARTILYNTYQSNGKSKNKNLEFIDADIAIDCAINEDNKHDDDDDDVSAKCVVDDDIEARIEAEVERKLKESKIIEEKKRVVAEAKAAAAAAVSLEENIRKEKKLKERIETEAKARFDARLIQEQKEIESKRKEIERINTEMKGKEARLRIEAQEEIARQKEMERKEAKVASVAQLQQMQQRWVHRTQTKKSPSVVLDIDDAFK